MLTSNKKNVVEFVEAYPGLYHIIWTRPGEFKLSAVKEFRRIEKEIRSRRGIGWLMESEKTHTQMHPIIEKLGGKKYAEDEHSFFFKKEIGRHV